MAKTNSIRRMLGILITIPSLVLSSSTCCAQSQSITTVFNAVSTRASNWNQFVAKQEDEDAETLSRFRQVILAALNHDSAHRHMPFVLHDDRPGAGKFSWRVNVLPFLEQRPLYERFDFKTAWDSEENLSAAKDMPKVFGANGKTDICWVRSPKLNGPFSNEAITDGSSNTIALVQNPNLVDWTALQDMTPDEVVDLVSGLADGEKIAVAFYDGSRMWISNECDIPTLRNALHPQDRNPVDKQKLHVNYKSKILPEYIERSSQNLEKANSLFSDGQYLSCIGVLESTASADSESDRNNLELLIRSYIAIDIDSMSNFRLLREHFGKQAKSSLEYRNSIGSALGRYKQLENDCSRIKHLVATYRVDIGDYTRSGALYLEILRDVSYVYEHQLVMQEVLANFEGLNTNLARVKIFVLPELVELTLLAESEKNLDASDWRRKLANVIRFYLLVDKPEQAERFLMARQERAKAFSKIGDGKSVFDDWQSQMAAIYRYRAKVILDAEDGNPVEAIAVLKTAISQEHDVRPSVNLETRSLIYRASKLVDRNLEAPELANALYDPNTDPDPPSNVAIDLSNRLRLSKKFDEAQQVLEHAMETNNKDDWLLIELADVYLARGDVDLAGKTLEQAYQQIFHSSFKNPPSYRSNRLPKEFRGQKIIDLQIRAAEVADKILNEQKRIESTKN